MKLILLPQFGHWKWLRRPSSVCAFDFLVSDYALQTDMGRLSALEDERYTALSLDG